MTQTLEPASAPSKERSVRDAWSLSLSGTWLIVQLEMKQRLRSTRWKVALGVLFLMIAAVALLTVASAKTFGADEGDAVFGLIVFFVLFLGLLVSPTLSATTINGDADAGTLAPLQSTPLSAVDIVVGKLIASWFASLALLAIAMPFIALGFFTATAEPAALVVVVFVLALELLVVCAFGIGWSALTSRTAASAVLTYMTIAVITAILPVLFGLSSALWTTSGTETYSYREYYDAKSAPPNALTDENGEKFVCKSDTYTNEMPRTDRLWWMLTVNPFVIVADSAPTPPQAAGDYYSTNGVLDSLKVAVREARLGPDDRASYSDCEPGLTQEQLERRNVRDSLSPLWPWGIGAQLLLGLAAIYAAVQRVRVPYRKLSGGTRVA